MNNVVLVGRLTADPNMRYVPTTGTPIASFMLAVDREYQKKDSEKETDFIPIQVWGKAAENCCNYLVKGSLVSIKGSIRVERYTKDDENRTATKINADRVQFLDNRNKDKSTFEAAGLGHEGFESVDMDDIPF